MILKTKCTVALIPTIKILIFVVPMAFAYRILLFCIAKLVLDNNHTEFYCKPLFISQPFDYFFLLHV